MNTVRQDQLLIRLNPLSLVSIAHVVLERFEKADEGQTFIEQVGEKVKKNDEAYALTRILVGKIKLHKVGLIIKLEF